MTALKPIENRNVRGVASERYPLNARCAHPECVEFALDPHHCFPRSQIGNDSWFVEITSYHPDSEIGVYVTIPHVTGLCRAHHEAVERHDAWIKLEEGYFLWWDEEPAWSVDPEVSERWKLVGPLNPQPGSRDGKPKRRRKTKDDSQRRKRENVQIRVPNDSEDGAGLWDDTQELIKERLIKEGLYDEGDRIPAYEAWMAAANDWLTSEGILRDIR